MYSHQRTAWDAVKKGHNPVVVTPTASGKTLCYNLPVLSEMAQHPETRALYLFPTKALSQDQMDEVVSLIDAIGLAGGFSENAKTRKLRVIEEGPGYTLVSRYNLKRYLKNGGAMGRVLVKPGSTIALGRINLDPISLTLNAISAVSMVSSTFLLWVNYASALQGGN